MITFKQFLESYKTKKHLVGTCKDFDENGNCTISQLPYTDTTHFAQAEENTTEITKDEFMNNVNLPDNLKDIDAIYFHDEDNDVFILYDDEKDIHYFFV